MGSSDRATAQAGTSTRACEASARLFEDACAVIPGGVNSPVRAFTAVGGTPRFITGAQGCWLTDADGNRYVDLVCSWGPMILGHAHPAVVEAVVKAASGGLSFGAPTPAESRLAAELISRVAPVERIRLVNSGTEATMSAVRLARGFTGRAKIVKFSGCYHGHVDALFADAGSGWRRWVCRPRPGSPARPRPTPSCCPTTTSTPCGKPSRASGNQIAAVITEASPGNMGVVPPAAGYNAALRAVTAEHGALLIVDEVMTGFRVSRSGWYGIDPVAADLFTFGKVMSGGLPAAAFGGRAEVMERLAPLGPVYQAGTLSGNPVAVAAGLATLRAADDAVYATLDANADRLARLLSEALTEAGVAHHVPRAGNMLSVFFGEAPVTDFASARASETWRYPPFFHALLDAGVYPPCSAFEAWFVSTALDDAAFDRIADALGAAARAAAREDGALMADQTRVHVVRHGEVHNPSGILYGRLPGFRLSDTGRAQADAVAEALADRDVVAVIASPLQRAQETATPIAAKHGLAVDTDPDLIESENFFEGRRVGPGDGAWRDPRFWWRLRDPFTPSWGEPYADIAARMAGAVDKARARARGPGCGVRQPPVAGLDAAAAPDRPAALARPAATGVRARIGDHPGLRGRPTGRRRIPPTGGAE